MPGRIMVVDDSATHRVMIRAKLAADYYDVLMAQTGTEALALVTREEPDLILLDSDLPDMDGLHLCARLKAMPETSHIPVIVMTSKISEDDRINGLESGADDFLVRPINDVALFARVRNLMRTKLMVDELRLRDATSREMGIDQMIEPVVPDLHDWHHVMVIGPSHHADMTEQAIRSEMRCNLIRVHYEADAMNHPKLEQVDAFVVHESLVSDDDGLRLVSALRGRPDTRHSAILLIIESDNIQNAATGLDLGANDYLIGQTVGHETVVRLRSQLRRKAYSDRLRSTVRDGLRLALIDPLTGLYNRRYLRQHGPVMVAQSARRGGQVAVMALDLDRFKTINDRYGHHAGDDVLDQFSKRLVSNIRPIDLAARIGGEEFCLIMPDVDGATAAEAGERVRAAIERPGFTLPNGQTIELTVSIGIAITSDPDYDVEMLLRDADCALYASKGGGRNRVSFHNSDAA